jgi:hypothetical protein
MTPTDQKSLYTHYVCLARMDAVISNDKLKISCVPVELSLPANVADLTPRQGGKR